MYVLTKKEWFENFILFLISISCFKLVIDTYLLHNIKYFHASEIFEIIINILFAIECVINIIS